MFKILMVMFVNSFFVVSFVLSISFVSNGLIFYLIFNIICILINVYIGVNYVMK